MDLEEILSTVEDDAIMNSKDTVEQLNLLNQIEEELNTNTNSQLTSNVSSLKQTIEKLSNPSVIINDSNNLSEKTQNTIHKLRNKSHNDKFS